MGMMLSTTIRPATMPLQEEMPTLLNIGVNLEESEYGTRELHLVSWIFVPKTPKSDESK
jgi:hypothetical protein